MSYDATRGTSRRQFLGRAAGAAAVVAGAGVGAGAIARSAAAATGRGYTSGRFMLALEGDQSGRFVGLDGGNLTNEVVEEAMGPDHIVHKHIGNPKYEDCTVQVGSGMGKGMYDWMKSSFDRTAASRRASIIVVGTRGEEAFRRSFTNALITEVSFPKLDVASTSVAQIPVTFGSQQVRDRRPSGLPVVGARQKAWLCSNFRLKIDGLNTTNRVSKIDSFTVKCKILDDGSVGTEVDNIVVTADVASALDWQQWLVNLQQGLNDERNGELTILGASAGGAITLSLLNLGIYQVRPDHAPGQLSNGRFKAEMYCEDIKFDYKSSWA